MEKTEKLVIIGSGPAGLTAAIYGCRADLEPLVFMGTRYGGQLMLTSEVENFPGFPDPVLGPDLISKMKSQAERLGARLVQEDVVKVNFRSYPFEVYTDAGVTKALAVIIATGANPRRLDLQSEMRLMGKGVSNCAVCDGFFFRGKRVAVVGGGDTAMEEATFLTKFASSVQVIHRRGELRASAALKKEAFENPKISFIWDSAVAEVIGEKKVEGARVKNLKTGSESEIPVDGLFVAIGYEPNTEIFRGQLELDPKGYLAVRNGTESSVLGVFVAGDVHDFRYRQAITAAADGCKALLDAEKFLKNKLEVKAAS
ncbi:MAG: thioredoxin-disulfide reductase [Nitrososphaerota archaeon]|jgi:thioredoxin reductase (NADPH)|nr:thioredoxin-disulfide reductase [Nitrososphaerota archaeon]MDG6921169.1 thioredoxin-disulfide reductase [Nitrososphaerota archaeon]MDG6949520.1 thioredoxin-disulfide reductase [Nitrososphaerota archaeon]